MWNNKGFIYLLLSGQKLVISRKLQPTSLWWMLKWGTWRRLAGKEIPWRMKVRRVFLEIHLAPSHKTYENIECEKNKRVFVHSFNFKNDPLEKGEDSFNKFVICLFIIGKYWIHCSSFLNITYNLKNSQVLL